MSAAPQAPPIPVPSVGAKLHDVATRFLSSPEWKAVAEDRARLEALGRDVAARHHAVTNLTDRANVAKSHGDFTGAGELDRQARTATAEWQAAFARRQEAEREMSFTVARAAGRLRAMAEAAIRPERENERDPAYQLGLDQQVNGFVSMLLSGVGPFAPQASGPALTPETILEATRTVRVHDPKRGTVELREWDRVSAGELGNDTMTAGLIASGALVVVAPGTPARSRWAVPAAGAPSNEPLPPAGAVPPLLVVNPGRSVAVHVGGGTVRYEAGDVLDADAVPNVAQLLRSGLVSPAPRDAVPTHKATSSAGRVVKVYSPGDFPG